MGLELGIEDGTRDAAMWGESFDWLVAGRPAQWPPDGRFHLGTDDVMVAFARELASAVSLSRRE